MKNTIAAIIFAISTYAASASVHADDSATQTGTQADKELPVISGEVRKVKPKSGKITIRHEEIPNLEMPRMTMVFRVDENTDISQFEKGDNVKFTVIEKDGKFMIVTINDDE